MKRILVLILVALSTSVVNAQPAQKDQKEPVKSPPATIPAKTPSAKDVTVPIPIIKELVDDIVNEKNETILSTDQIEALREKSAKARQTEPFFYPDKFVAKPVYKRIEIRADENDNEPRMIRLFYGMVTTIVFSDQNGNPWLVNNVSIECKLFDDGRLCSAGDKKAEPTNVIKLWPKRPYAYGNIVVELEGQPSPYTFLLSTGQSTENDVKVSVRVEGRNPGARPQVINFDRLPEHDSNIAYFLDGVPPEGAKRVKVSGGQAEGWLLNNSLYIRTRLNILSPAFINHVGSADGMRVYKFFSPHPNLLASKDGQTMTIFITGY